MFSKKRNILLHRVLKAFLIHPEIPKNSVACFSPLLPTLPFVFSPALRACVGQEDAFPAPPWSCAVGDCCSVLALIQGT